MPVAVPRVSGLREAVDDHQVAFCRHLAATGRVLLADSPAGLTAALEEPPPRLGPCSAGGEDAALRLGALVEDLLGRGGAGGPGRAGPGRRRRR